MVNTIGHRIQWHPPFYTALQVELEQENLDFEDEYCVRKYNLVEYKPPGDYLSIDDYFYMQGNAGLLKAGGQHTNEIQVDEVSVTFVCYGVPRKLMRFLEEHRNLRRTEKFSGIYYVEEEVFFTQIIVTRRLDPETIAHKLGLPVEVVKGLRSR